MVSALATDQMPDGWGAVFAGVISPPSHLAELNAIAGWEHVDYRGNLAPDDARDLLRNCQIGFVVLRGVPAYLDSLPTKLFEYFDAGIPVIASDFPLWRSLVLDPDTGPCGQLVDEKSPHAIAAAVRRYSENPDLLRAHGENARRAAKERFNWTLEERSLLAAYASISSGTASREMQAEEPRW
jgi:glycosyltransferase involved in cell wall biosynthesis